MRINMISYYPFPGLYTNKGSTFNCKISSLCIGNYDLVLVHDVLVLTKHKAEATLNCKKSSTCIETL